MIITTRTFTKTSNSIPWHYEQLNDALLFQVRLTEDFINTGKILYKDVDISFDGLTMTVSIHWDSIESMNEHFNDPLNVIYFAERDTYNNYTNITMSDISVLEV